MDAVLKSVKLPSDTEKDQIANMILGEILSLKVTLLHIELKYAEKATKLRNLHLRFVLCSASQIYSGDFTKFCDLLIIYELYIITIDTKLKFSRKVAQAVVKSWR